MRVFGVLKFTAKFLRGIEIKICHMPIMGLAKTLHHPSLSNLASTLYYQRFARMAILPNSKFFYNVTM